MTFNVLTDSRYGKMLYNSIRGGAMTRDEFEAQHVPPQFRNNPAYEISACTCDWPPCHGWILHPAGQPDPAKNTPEWDQMAEESGWNEANPTLAALIRMIYG